MKTKSPARGSGKRVLESRAIYKTPPRHVLRLGDARELDWISDASVHLVVTSPPYWTLKKYNDHPDQLGNVTDYQEFQAELGKVC